jgi:hypothetical protein
MRAEQETEASWHTMTEEVVSELAEWRVQHPRATLREIEQAVDERLAGVRARMVQDMALRSTQRDVCALPAAERPVCPHCGVVLEADHKPQSRDPPGPELRRLPHLWRRTFPPWMKNWRCRPGI